MRRINLEEIRRDGKEPRKFAYLYPDDKHPRPRVHQLEHFADDATGSNLLEAVIVSERKFKEICEAYRKILDEDNNELSKERRRDLENTAYEENFVPEHHGMLLFYHPQKNELRGREVQTPDVR